jgi:hypothetical protein
MAKKRTKGEGGGGKKKRKTDGKLEQFTAKKPSFILKMKAGYLPLSLRQISQETYKTKQKNAPISS